MALTVITMAMVALEVGVLGVLVALVGLRRRD